jgi:hypothetical protein
VKVEGTLTFNVTNPKQIWGSLFEKLPSCVEAFNHAIDLIYV